MEWAFTEVTLLLWQGLRLGKPRHERLHGAYGPSLTSFLAARLPKKPAARQTGLQQSKGQDSYHRNQQRS